MIEFKKGDYVHYTAPYGKKENGIVKSVNDSGNLAFVVYKCGGDWENYENYTGAATNIKDLTHGWADSDNSNQ